MVLEEAARLPLSSVRNARAIAWIGPPEGLWHMVTRVREQRGGALAEIHRVIDDRIGSAAGTVVGAYYAASELALIEEVWRSELDPSDRALLQAPWMHLLEP